MLQTVHVMINSTGMINFLDDLEVLAILFAAACHDVEHTGTTNDFHKDTFSDLAQVNKFCSRKCSHDFLAV